MILPASMMVRALSSRGRFGSIMVRVYFFTLSILTAVSSASVTAGWKVPIGHFAADYQTNDKVHKLEKPPGASAFIKEGDELWDVSRVMAPLDVLEAGDDPFAPASRKKIPEWKGEWLVWNARSGMVVARGSWADILLAEKGVRFRDLDFRCRTDLDLVTRQDEGQPPETRTLSVLGGHGEESSSTLDGAVLNWAVGTSTGSTAYPHQLKLSLSWPAGPEESKWEVSTIVGLQDGERTRLARHGAGKGSWELYARVCAESMDSTLMSKARLLETSQGLTEWPLQRNIPRSTITPLASGLYAMSYDVPEDLGRITGDVPFTDAPDIEAPAELAGWIHGPVLDFSHRFAAMGLGVQLPGCVAVYDPRTARIGLVAERSILENLESVIEQTCCGSKFGSMWIETNPECGNWGLACRSGERSSIVRTDGDEKGEALRSEMTVGGDDTTIDFRYTIDFPDSAGGSGGLESAALLHVGVPQTLLSYFSAAGERKLIITISKNQP